MSITILQAVRRGLLLPLLLASCVPSYRVMYEEPQRPVEQVARIQPGGGFFLRALDGKELANLEGVPNKPSWSGIEVLPGFHRVELGCTIVDREINVEGMAAGIAIGLLTLGVVQLPVGATRTVVRDTLIVSHFYRFEAGHSYKYEEHDEPPVSESKDLGRRARYAACYQHVATARFRSKPASEVEPGEIGVWESRSLYLADQTALKELEARQR